MHSRISLNTGWKYRPEFESAFVSAGYDDGSWDSVDIPHTNRMLPYNGFDEKDFQFVSCYRRTLDIPQTATGRICSLHFEGVMTACTIYVDGVVAGAHRGGYTEFSIDISRFVTPGNSHVLSVEVDSRELSDVPPFGHVVDYLTYGGIYREVQLEIFDGPRISRFQLVDMPSPESGPMKNLPLGNLRYLLEVDSPEAAPASDVLLKLRVLSGDQEVAFLETPPAFSPLDDPDGEPGASYAAFVTLPSGGFRLWSPEEPVLYTIEASLYRRGSGELQYCWSEKSGFRYAKWTEKGFVFNGSLRKLIGLNRHQSFPFAGYAMPRRVQEQDARILKNELGLDIVRTSHYPQSRHFLNECDELGLLVMEEIPGWQYIGEGEWKEQSYRDTADMIRSHAHHPAIVLWGVRINESPDDHSFFSRTNEIARSMDPLRQTGGVRNFAGSEFLEDVYTFNDFSHNGETPALRPRQAVAGGKVPYLVTEHNGHMYPTKRFDQEERQVEHSLRHLRVINAAQGKGDVAGAIGWCAFDYNTHQEFGSGDRICYHGVMDMFRLPKFAAYAYASQINPEKRVVMEPLSLFALGERAEAKSLPFYVFTNCDSITVERNGTIIGEFYPDSGKFPHLEYPPVFIRELVGNRLNGYGFAPAELVFLKSVLADVLEFGLHKLKLGKRMQLFALLRRKNISHSEAERMFNHAATGWGDGEQTYRIRGFIAGEEVAVRDYGSSVPTKLVIIADDTVLDGGLAAVDGTDSAGSQAAGPYGESWDATRVQIRLEDQYRNLCPYVAETVSLEIEGPGEIIGPKLFPLIGGVFAVWVRTSGGAAGEIVLKASCSRFAAEDLKITTGVAE